MFKWNHLHSLGVGSLLTLAFLSDHLLWTLSMVFVFGILIGRSWSSINHFLSRRGYGPLRLIKGDDE